MRSGYGKKIRGHFAEKNPLVVIDFGGFKVFDSATVDTNVLLVQNSENQESLFACHFEGDYMKGTSIHDYCRDNGFRLSGLTENTWFIGKPKELALKEKIEKIGKPVKEWDIKISYGIKTGLNEAFIIDETTRAKLISQDSKSEEIIKPILRGRDIKRYSYEFAGLYIIIAKFGSYKTIEQKYPAVYNHLKKYEDKLKTRGQCKGTRSGKSSSPDYPGQHHWLELDNNPQDSYIEQFEKEKIVWIELVDDGRFSYVKPGVYTEATTFLMTFQRPKYLVGLMNSKVVNWYFDKICGESGVGTNRWKKFYVEAIPLPEINEDSEPTVNNIENLVDQILAIKEEDPKTSISDLEKQIDESVYQLYGLTSEEIELINYE